MSFFTKKTRDNRQGRRGSIRVTIWYLLCHFFPVTVLEKVVDLGNLVPRKYLGCKKIFSPNPVLLSKIKNCVANPVLLEFRLMKGKFFFKLGVNVQMLNFYYFKISLYICISSIAKSFQSQSSPFSITSTDAELPEEVIENGEDWLKIFWYARNTDV